MLGLRRRNLTGSSHVYGRVFTMTTSACVTASTDVRKPRRDGARPQRDGELPNSGWLAAANGVYCELGDSVSTATANATTAQRHRSPELPGHGGGIRDAGDTAQDAQPVV